MKVFTKCGCCLSETDLSLATPVLLKIYQFLVQEQVADIKICPTCTKILKDIEALQRKCRQSLNTFRIKLEESSSECEPDRVECHHCNVSVIKRKYLEHWKSKHNKYCEICNQDFKNTRQLKHHTASEHIERIFACSECPMRFAKRVSQAVHVQRIHQKEKKFKCIICDASFFDKLAAERHLFVHGGKRLKCHLCFTGFADERIIKRHYEAVHGIVKSSKAVLRMVSQGTPEASLDCIVRIDVKPSRLIVDSVKEQFKVLFCDICNKQCKNKARLMDHLDTVHSQKRFQCCHCGKLFPRQNILNMHVKAKHKFRKCEKCGKTFSLKGLAAHVKRVHSGRKDYRCSICGLEFLGRYAVYRHLFSHGNTKWLNCHICSEGFSDARMIKKHYLKKHEIDQSITEIRKIAIEGDLEVSYSCIEKINK